MNKVVNSINTNLNYIKVFIEKLYQNTVSQILRQQRKILASYYEMSNLKKKDVEFGDDFRSSDKIESEENLVCDKDGYSLGFISKKVAFNLEYYGKSMYPMVMNGKPVHGSDFRKIFENNEGFWSYQSDTVEPFEFLLSFETKSMINKIYIRTHNKVALTLYVRNADNSEFEEIGSREGIYHVWNFWPREITEIKVSGLSNLICINYIDACLAKYKTSGTFISKPFTIENLHKLELIRDTCIPAGSQLNLYIKIIMDGVENERIPIDESIITDGGISGIEWLSYATKNYLDPDLYELDTNYVSDSLLVRDGYHEFDTVNTEDWAWETENLPINGKTGYVKFDSITYDHKIVDNGVTKVYIDPNAEFGKDSDYTIGYNLSEKKVMVHKMGTNIPVSALCIPDPTQVPDDPDDEETLKCEIILRRKVIVKQKRIYIELLKDLDVTVSPNLPSGAGYRCTIKHLNMLNKINNENKVYKVYADGSYTFKGLKGTNLVEIEYFLNNVAYLPSVEGQKPTITNIDNLIAFAHKYSLKQIAYKDFGDPDKGTYWITGSKKIEISPGYTDIFIKYAKSISAEVKVVLIAELVGNMGWITPTLRSYELKNTIVKGDLV